MPEESKISKAQQKAVHKYVKNNYDRIELTVPKGQKDIIKAAEVAREKFMEAEAQKLKRAYQSSLYGIYPPKVLHIQTKEEEQ